MIDKELIRQAAEDIDLFGDDLSAEFERLCQPRTRSISLWHYAAAACIALLLAVGGYVLLSVDNEATGGQKIAEAKPSITAVQEHAGEPTLAEYKSEITQHASPIGEKTRPTQQTSPLRGDEREAPVAAADDAPTGYVPTLEVMEPDALPDQASDISIPEMEEPADADQEFLYAILAEVDARVKMDEEEDKLFLQDIRDEISHNIEKQTIQAELTL